MNGRRVAVVGLGVATSLGLDVEALWASVLAGHSGVRHVRQFPSEGFPVRIGSEVDLDAVRARFGPDEPATSRTMTFARWAADRAWAAAGLDGSRAIGPRGATCIGAGGCPAIEDRLDGLTPALLDDGAAQLVRALGQARAGRVTAAPEDLDAVSRALAVRFGLHGPSMTVHSACASATQAIGEAYRLIRSGRADVVLTGGADSMMSMFCVAGFTLLGALSRRSDPAAASRPFDRERDGFVLGEGGGMIVLEEWEQAVKRGAEPIAEIIGYGSSMDAYRFTDVHPDGRGAATCMLRALADAGVAADAIDYVNAHGTSTVQNDRVETQAIKTVFGAAARRLAVSSTKSQLGHLLCAAGGVELILTVLALRDGVAPPTINLEHPDPDCDLDYVPNEARRLDLSVAISNSFGFGGQNGTLVVRRAQAGGA
jgi:3-oxoacyl-[acyl-carrier-protein] synthase II